MGYFMTKKVNKIIRDIDSLVEPFKSEIESLIKVLESDPDTAILKVFETGRTYVRQKWLYANKRSKTLRSKHLIGCACDFAPHGVDGWSWGDRDVDRSGSSDNEKLAFYMMREIVKADFPNLKFLGEWDMAHIELVNRLIPSKKA